MEDMVFESQQMKRNWAWNQIVLTFFFQKVMFVESIWVPEFEIPLLVPPQGEYEEMKEREEKKIGRLQEFLRKLTSESHLPC